MKIVGVMALHYGIDYLPYAVRSIINDVDTMLFLYTPKGNHSGESHLPLPEYEQAAYLFDAARRAAGSKFAWYTGLDWRTEGEQRDSMYQIAPDADRYLVVDADEMWSEGLARAVIAASASAPNVREWRVPMVHLWKGFDRAILHDPAYPVRLINPHAPQGTSTTFDALAHDAAKRELLARTCDYVPVFYSRIVHAGYAIRPDLMLYKWGCHGHKAEYRKDIDWFAERYMNDAATTDLHPVGSDYWNAERINIRDYLPEWIQEHPFYGVRPLNQAVAA